MLKVKVIDENHEKDLEMRYEGKAQDMAKDMAQDMAKIGRAHV